VTSWHCVHTKFHEFPSRYSKVIKCVQTDISCEDVGLGQDRFGKVCDAHAQRVMGNGVIIIPPHDFKQSSRWYYRV
jgi:hypothetical protein